MKKNFPLLQKTGDKRQRNPSNFRFSIINLLLILFVISLPSVLAPPTPHSISGTIFESGGVTQVPLGTDYYINDTTSGDFVQGVTHYNFSGFSGFYFESVSGTDGDSVVVRSWNVSSYGELFLSLLGSLSNQDVVLNLSRGPEPTVNITSPGDDVLRNDSSPFVVSSTISLFGSDATNCSSSISYSNSSVLASFGGEPTSLNLGSLSRGFSQIIDWNVSGVGVGSSDVQVDFTCDTPANITFEVLTSVDSITNVTIEDTTAPNITLISPINGSQQISPDVLFEYNVSDNSALINCSLYIDAVLNQTNTSVTTDTLLNFTASLSDGWHNWSIMCTDSANNAGSSPTYDLFVGGATVLFDKASYLQGETVKISGEGYEDGIVTVNVTRSDSSTDVWNTTAAGGTINTTYFINYSYSTGEYVVSTYNYFNTSINGSANFTVILRVPGLTTDKATYNENESVIITGEYFSINSSINLSVFQNTSGVPGPGFPLIVLANESGNFTYSWNTTNTCTGVYGVTANDLNWTPYSETTYFNITGPAECVDWGNTAPNITFVEVDDNTTIPQNEISLLAGQNTSITCNVTASDADGFADVIKANATLHYFLNGSNDPDNNNFHYSQTNCTNDGNDGANETYFSCDFNITYYATNGTWYCSANAVDSQSNVGSANDSTILNELLALNVTSLIDYGDFPTGNISDEKFAIVTNFGNIEIDVGLEAYAVTIGDGKALNCSIADINLGDERYSLNTGDAFNAMTPVTNSSITLVNFNLPKQDNETVSQRNVYWRLRATEFSKGLCQGVVIFTATV